MAPAVCSGVVGAAAAAARISGSLSRSFISARREEGIGHGPLVQDGQLRIGMARPHWMQRRVPSPDDTAGGSCCSRRCRGSKKVKVSKRYDGGGVALHAGILRQGSNTSGHSLLSTWIYGSKWKGRLGRGTEGIATEGEQLTTESVTSNKNRRTSRKLSTGVRADAAAADSQQGYQVELQTRQDVAKASVFHLYRRPLLSPGTTTTLLHQVQKKISHEIEAIETEQCFNIAVDELLDHAAMEKMRWLLRETYEQDMLTDESGLTWPTLGGRASAVVEVGPRLSFTTAWSTNAVSICRACGLSSVTRLERSRRYKLIMNMSTAPPSTEMQLKFASMVHDRMTECIYPSRLTSFVTDVTPAPVIRIPIIEEGEAALRAINKSMGLAFDEWDIQYYTKLFRDDIKRNPTNVELFDIAQSNSEHSRHWFFKARLNIDDEAVPESLMQIVQATLKANPNNSVIGFHDNSSAIRGFSVTPLMPHAPDQPSPVAPVQRNLDILFTAETHNFPCAVAPFPGAETGAGGRIRDTHATGIGSLVVAATAGYCVGNLQLDGNSFPWEDKSFVYPPNLASPLQILLDASDGASDYGNKFGEPLIQGYTRTFGLRLPNGERREWLKPIMFSAGIGQIDDNHLTKEQPEIGMLVVKVGGPAYRIGMGGGAASSMVSGDNDAELDFNAVQRGDAEMAQKLYRVVRTCVEMGEKNPIISIHDQGAGGNCNVVKEIIYPKGAEIDIRSIVVGDDTMSVLEIWGAEYQEQDALLVKPESEELIRRICARERVSIAVIGTISGDGKVVLVDKWAEEEAQREGLPEPLPVVDLDLEKVLGDMPRKEFSFTRQKGGCSPLDIPTGVTAMDALERILRLPSVSSKRFLTTKVDRSVSGLVAQQQTVGPLQLTLADVAVIAQTHLGTTGGACAIGEQPLKGLVDPKAMARMGLGEALTNLVWAKVTALRDVKASGNWMYAAKMDGEGAAMYDAAVALRDAMIELEVAIDGGKDSLSMAAQAGGETVKAPGNLVISAYVTCSDITKTITPDLKLGDAGALLFVDLAQGKRRLGGSAFAQVYSQVGDESPDLEDTAVLRNAFNTVQSLIDDGSISAGHDVSDGGIAVALLEMAFAGNCGISVDLPSPASEPGKRDVLAALFAEELGLVIEVDRSREEAVLGRFVDSGVPCVRIGQVQSSQTVSLSFNGVEHIKGETATLRDIWEETSFCLESLQRAEECVRQEKDSLKHRKAPAWELSFTPEWTPKDVMESSGKPKVAVVREEGSNGDREMSAALCMAGLEPWDVMMSDLLSGSTSLDSFQGVVFVGGFSYADVLDSAKGWAGTIRFNKGLLEQFQNFYNRKDTFSLGVCNGCQLMALLGWVPGHHLLGLGRDEVQPRFVHNESGRFESRFSTVQIQKSPSIMLQGMEGSKLGIWVAHGEGRALFPEKQVLDRVLQNGLAPVRYSDDDGNITEAYPFNPNGSPEGIAALCSADGRHLAIMPHPERCFMMWQFPWSPASWEAKVEKSGPSPWLRMFQNARMWCESQ